MNIYLICTGNTCRSPMAEAVLRARKINKVEVRSAGIHAVQGMPISDHATTLIEQAGMPYTATSNLVAETDVVWADYIFTMTDVHKQVMRMQFPNEANKIFTLKEFVAHGDGLNVQDPFGGSLEVYRQTFEELIILMEKLEEKLLGGHAGEKN